MVLEPALENVPARRLSLDGGGHEAVCASKDVGPQTRWMERSHINWRNGMNASENTEGKLKGNPTSVEKGNKIFFIKVWKLSLANVLKKPWGKTRKNKPKEDNITCKFNHPSLFAKDKHIPSSFHSSHLPLLMGAANAMPSIYYYL